MSSTPSKLPASASKTASSHAIDSTSTPTKNLTREDIRKMTFPSPAASTSSPIAPVASTSSKRTVDEVAGEDEEKEGSINKKQKVTGEKAGVVKKVIQMPGMFPKAGPSSSTTSTTLPPSLKSNLSLPLPPTSTSPAEIAALKSSFIDSLTSELKDLLKMEIETMSDDWLMAMRGELVKGYFGELKKFVTAEQKSKKVFPPEQDVYAWTRLCPLAGIRVVIIGQDPYHNDGQAHGLAFSVRKGVAVPPSLKNMYKELEAEIPGFKAPKHGDLSSWAKQGVLMLNTSLTVRAHEAFSHSKKGWETFTTAVLKVIVDRLADTSSTSSSTKASEGKEEGAHGVVFMAWGNPAQKVCAGISERHHHVLKSAHPSPLSASRGFLGNGHFVKCNEWLEEKYGVGKGIRWESVMDE